MSKPALGRGLGGLLASNQRDVPAALLPGAANEPPSGVELLLRGEVPPAGQPSSPPPEPSAPEPLATPTPSAAQPPHPAPTSASPALPSQGTSVPTTTRPSPQALPSWALGCLLLADLLLVLVAAWVALASHAPGRLVVATVLVTLGGGLLSLGVRLRGERGAAELQSLNPFDEERPRIRVQFLDQKR